MSAVGHELVGAELQVVRLREQTVQQLDKPSVPGPSGLHLDLYRRRPEPFRRSANEDLSASAGRLHKSDCQLYTMYLRRRLGHHLRGQHRRPAALQRRHRRLSAHQPHRRPAGAAARQRHGAHAGRLAVGGHVGARADVPQPQGPQRPPGAAHRGPQRRHLRVGRGRRQQGQPLAQRAGRGHLHAQHGDGHGPPRAHAHRRRLLRRSHHSRRQPRQHLCRQRGRTDALRQRQPLVCRHRLRHHTDTSTSAPTAAAPVGCA